MTSLPEIVDYTNDFLRIREIGDWDNALNGLQIENSGDVTKIGASVDASTRVLAAAAKQNVDLVIVHHGLFWQGLQPVTGSLRRQLELAFENNIALYSAHLPLDLHSQVGNNAQLAAALGLTSIQPFFEEKGQLIGVKARVSLPRDEVDRKLQKALEWSRKSLHVRSEENWNNRDHHRRRRLGNLQACTGGNRHIYHGGSAALGGSGGRRAWDESPARRTLRHRSFRCKSAGGAFVQTIQNSMGFHRLPNGNVTVIRMINDEALSTRVRHFCFVLAVLLIIPSSTLASVKGRPTQLSGYKAVRVHYRPLNKMIMSVRINGQRANLLVDTGSSQIILDAACSCIVWGTNRRKAVCAISS